mmetsp:Transcript_1604/g.3194  ORF Transcript_1604/g.3194 Transcript_1604/m.3194 type:complete len:289 (+) Transcript_1604:409-1275(+)
MLVWRRVEWRGGDGDHARLEREPAAQRPVARHARRGGGGLPHVLVGHMQRARVGHQEEAALPRERLHTALGQRRAEQSALLLVHGAEPRVVRTVALVRLVGERQHARERLLHRRGRAKLHKRQHQLDRLDQPRGADTPAVLPARDGEGLPRRRERHRAVEHVRQRREVHVLAARVDDVLVHLVRDNEKVGAASDDVGDRLHLGLGEHLPRRVVRRVEDEKLRARSHRLLERVGVELPLSRGLVELERDWNHRRARQAHLPVVEVKRGLKQQDFVARVDEGLQRHVESL